MLKTASGAGFPIRVAIIASRSDLGSVTALWRKPTSYARFLGLELSLAYKQRLLAVMPNGFGFNWPGHSPAAAYARLARIPIKPGGLFLAAQTAVRALAAAHGHQARPDERGAGIERRPSKQRGRERGWGLRGAGQTISWRGSR